VSELRTSDRVREELGDEATDLAQRGDPGREYLTAEALEALLVELARLEDLDSGPGE
jgi:hypothetical protein